MEGVMIAFLPAYFPFPPTEASKFPHLTLVYAGTTDERSASEINVLTKEAVSLSRLLTQFSLPVMGIDLLGPPEELVKVLALHPSPQLITARQMVEGWNKSEYKEFRPHVTIGYENTDVEVLPESVYFDRMSVNWGDKSLVIPLR